MKRCKNMLRRFVLLLTVLCLLVAIPTPAYAANFGPRYDSQKAVSYAVNHWDDNIGVCDEFVKDCLMAGGVEILAGGVDPLKDALVDAKLGTAQNLVISADGVHALNTENPKVQAGDILFFFCKECNRSIHTAIVGGYDSKGYLYTYGHNPGWDKVDWIGNFTHTLDDGQQHRKCYDYIVVTMDRKDYSHTHNFTTDLYEEAHPHKMYAKCSCNAKYYLGWNATVSYCTDCNPPVGDKPVLTAVYNGSAVALNWTTVYGALEYQVYRSTHKTGNYFSIYAAMGTSMNNSSVTEGNIYYYKVVAVLEKDSKGNPTKTAESAIVACAVGDMGVNEIPVLTATYDGTAVALNWTTVHGALEYQVYRSISETGTFYSLFTGLATKMTNKSVTEGNIYYYKVVAVLEKDSKGNPTKTTESEIVACPVGVTEGNDVPVLTATYNGTGVSLNWTTVPGALEYQVWRATSKTGTFFNIYSALGTKMTNKSVTEGNIYYYKVVAVLAKDGSGNATKTTESEIVACPVGDVKTVTRLAGSNRYETALKVADQLKEVLKVKKFDAVIVACGSDFADALAGSYLSTVKNAPILLSFGGGGKYAYLDTNNINYIKNNLTDGGTVYLLGGKNAVPELYEEGLSGFKVTRLGGKNRFDTNLLILKEAGVKAGSEILVCTSTNFADSLSASATGKPILLVFNESGKLYGDQPDYLKSLKNCTFTVVGGENAVSEKLVKAISNYGKVERLAGKDRFETSVLVAQKYFKNATSAVLAYAWNYPDGLCGGALAYAMKAPLVLTMTKYEAKAAAYAKAEGIGSGMVLGADSLISDKSVTTIFGKAPTA